MLGLKQVHMFADKYIWENKKDINKAFSLFYKLNDSVLINSIFKLHLYTQSFGSFLFYQLQFLKPIIINVLVSAHISWQ